MPENFHPSLEELGLNPKLNKEEIVASSDFAKKTEYKSTGPDQIEKAYVPFTEKLAEQTQAELKKSGIIDRIRGSKLARDLFFSIGILAGAAEMQPSVAEEFHRNTESAVTRSAPEKSDRRRLVQIIELIQAVTIGKRKSAEQVDYKGKRATQYAADTIVRGDDNSILARYESTYLRGDEEKGVCVKKEFNIGNADMNVYVFDIDSEDVAGDLGRENLHEADGVFDSVVYVKGRVPSGSALDAQIKADGFTQNIKGVDERKPLLSDTDRGSGAQEVSFYFRKPDGSIHRIGSEPVDMVQRFQKSPEEIQSTGQLVIDSLGAHIKQSQKRKK
jgi:hypothetical protein